MPQTGDRIYRAQYADGTPVLYGDVGHKLKIVGLILSGVQDYGMQVIVPGEQTLPGSDIFYPTLAEWQAVIDASDDPVYFTENLGAKIAHRKVERQISGMVQQKVWARDGFACVYCGKKMGEVQLTIDHWLPLELGGSDENTNLVSCCRKENKRKGDQDPETYCIQNHINIKSVMAHLLLPLP